MRRVCADAPKPCYTSAISARVPLLPPPPLFPSGEQTNRQPSKFTGMAAPSGLPNPGEAKPLADANAVKLFEELGQVHGVDPITTTWLTAPDGFNAKSLDDLLYACNEDGVGDLIVAANPDNPLLAESRLRQAWRALKRARDTEEKTTRAGHDSVDMDELLTASILDDIESRHWARYKMTWPPSLAPSDTLISRIVRELKKRTLSVQVVFKVRTQAHQQKDVRKRTRVAEGLEMISSSVDRDAPPTLTNYMNNLLTLMVAYSKAGNEPRADAPATEPKTVDSTKIVECPLDVLMRYYYRVRDRAYALPHFKALAWVQRKDEAERTVWVDRFRNTTESLGEIIQYTMQTREVMWELPPPDPRPVPDTPPGGGKGKGKKGKPSLELASKAPPAVPPKGKRADALRDGTKLCHKYNQGRCTYSAQQCNWAHRCSVVKPNGDACGQQHPAVNHR